MTPTSSDAQPALLGAKGVDRAGEASPISGTPGLEEPSKHDPEFEAAVEDYRRLVGSNAPFLFPRLEDQIRRWLGVAPSGIGSFFVALLAGIGIRLGVAIAATALVGDWAGISWAR